MFKEIILLIIGFILLIKGADILVEGSSDLAERFKIPQIIIGLTIVAFGTSAPEAAISISAAIKHSSGIAIGNVLGSNIFNIFIVLGIASVITSIDVEKSAIKRDLPFMIFISVSLLVLGFIFKELYIVSGIILWVLFGIFMIRIITTINGNDKNIEIEKKLEEDRDKKPKNPLIFMIIKIIIGLAGIIYGSDLTVNSASSIALIIGLSERFIGLTVVSFGTSLPELVTSIMAAIKGKTDIAVGNIVGSNIFNILFVLGTASLIAPIPFAANFYIDAVVCIVAAILLYFFALKDRKLGKLSGTVFLLSYGAYFIYLLVQ